MYSVRPARSFEKDTELLLKKYASLKQELANLGRELANNPTLGTSLGKDCYKIRLAIKSKGKGKSGGARVVTYVITDNSEIILLTIYDKQSKADLGPNELDILLRDFDN